MGVLATELLRPEQTRQGPNKYDSWGLPSAKTKLIPSNKI